MMRCARTIFRPPPLRRHACLVLLPLVFASGCNEMPGASIGQEFGLEQPAQLSGTYIHVSGRRMGAYQSVVFMEGGRAILSPSGDMVTAVLDGNKVIIGSGFGGTQGELQGDRMIFPDGHGVVSGAFGGVWEKRQ